MARTGHNALCHYWFVDVPHLVAMNFNVYVRVDYKNHTVVQWYYHSLLQTTP